MEPRLVKCFFYRLYIPQILQISIEQKKSKRRVHNKQTKKLKSINNQSTINQSKYKSFTPAWYLAKILNKRHGKTKENTRKVNKNGRMNKKSSKIAVGRETNFQLQLTVAS